MKRRILSRVLGASPAVVLLLSAAAGSQQPAPALSGVAASPNWSVKCHGIGPAIDLEEGPKGLGAHSDQERILESELYRFVRFDWDVVTQLAARR